jgi:ABC-type phosphate transport system substrate-binding protein
MVIMALGLPARAQMTDVAVVVNQENAVSNLSVGELRKILVGEKRSWPGGSPIKLFVRGSGTRERLVLLKLLGMSEMDYKQYWTAQVYRGEAQAEPVELPSIGMTKEAVSTYRGAITLIGASDLKSGMKVLKVDGHLPGQEGYPLR